MRGYSCAYLDLFLHEPLQVWEPHTSRFGQKKWLTPDYARFMSDTSSAHHQDYYKKRWCGHTIDDLGQYNRRYAYLTECTTILGGEMLPNNVYG
jgi:hypothetical protein